MKEASNARLSGLRVLVPRPHPQGDELTARILDSGGEAVHSPVIEISPPDSFDELDHCLSRLDCFSLVVMVSSSAAAAVANRLDQLGIGIPAATMVAAIGPKTSRCLGEKGIRVNFETSSRIDTEGIVQVLEPVELDGRNVCIFRAQDGREELKASLESRGSCVVYATCYIRSVTSRPYNQTLLRWNTTGFDAVVITSASILDALLFLLGEKNRQLLFDTPVVTISDRLRNQCLGSGIKSVIVCDPVTDSMIDALATMVKP